MQSDLLFMDCRATHSRHTLGSTRAGPISSSNSNTRDFCGRRFDEILWGILRHRHHAGKLAITPTLGIPDSASLFAPVLLATTLVVTRHNASVPNVEGNVAFDHGEIALKPRKQLSLAKVCVLLSFVGATKPWQRQEVQNVSESATTPTLTQSIAGHQGRVSGKDRAKQQPPQGFVVLYSLRVTYGTASSNCKPKLNCKR
jgi:hypothetical protein